MGSEYVCVCVCVCACECITSLLFNKLSSWAKMYADIKRLKCDFYNDDRQCAICVSSQ